MVASWQSLRFLPSRHMTVLLSLCSCPFPLVLCVWDILLCSLMKTSARIYVPHGMTQSQPFYLSLSLFLIYIWILFLYKATIIVLRVRKYAYRFGYTPQPAAAIRIFCTLNCSHFDSNVFCFLKKVLTLNK